MLLVIFGAQRICASEWWEAHDWSGFSGGGKLSRNVNDFALREAPLPAARLLLALVHEFGLEVMGERGRSRILA